MRRSDIVHIGDRIETEGRPHFYARLDILLRSNLLVQANSGGGKSYALRRMIEQAFGLVPQIIIDPEGEFSTLREKFDVILVGKGGDTPADVRSAKLLAERLLQLGTSAVIDLYEIPKLDRPVWVAAFVRALVDAPKNLWRDLLIYVDEAHEFAPQPGHGITESVAEKACRSALIDLSTRGRKRGFGVVAATQRLGKLSKDFAAELKNVLVGQTFMDIDRERAAGDLGISKAHKLVFFDKVKMLPPGNFYALGLAFDCREHKMIHVGPVATSHPEAGRKQKAAPPPTAKIKHLLPQLADLPQEAEAVAQTEKQLRAEIADLKRQLATRPTQTIVQGPSKADMLADQKIAKLLTESTAKLVKALDAHTTVGEQVTKSVTAALEAMRAITRTRSSAPGEPAFKSPTWPKTDARPAPPSAPPARREPPAQTNGEAPPRLAEKTQRMIAALRQGEAMGLAKMPFAHVAVIAGVSPTSGTTRNRKGELTAGGYVTVIGKDLQLTDAGRAFPIDAEMPPTEPRALCRYWQEEIGTEKVAAMLGYIVEKGTATDEELANVARMEQSGTFRNYKGELTRRGLMIKNGDHYEAAEVFRRQRA